MNMLRTCFSCIFRHDVLLVPRFMRRGDKVRAFCEEIEVDCRFVGHRLWCFFTLSLRLSRGDVFFLL